MSCDKNVLAIQLKHGLIEAVSDGEYPCKIYGYQPQNGALIIDERGTFYGFVLSGTAILIIDDKKVKTVSEGEYFCQNIEQRLCLSGCFDGYIVLSQNYLGLNVIGGPLENRGRLKYIDGCSDTLLISPPVKGDPCFNFLKIPPNIDQTFHTHPSIRVGLIVEGRGTCRTHDGDKPLNKGTLFILYPDAVHGFETLGTEGLSIVIFHPDSDFGPTHEEHPMLNKTIVDGMSAKYVHDIRTRNIES